MTRAETSFVPVSLGLGIALLGAALAGSCTVNKNPHDDKKPTFPLEGVHNAIECEACHGDGEFGALPTDCVACHEADRPKKHYGQQSCGNDGCHTPVGWKATGGLGDDDDDDDDIVTPGDDDDDDIVTTPGDDDDDTTTPGDDDDTTTPGDDDDDTTTDTGTAGHEFFPLVGVHAQGCNVCHVNFPTTDTERLVCKDCHEADRSDLYHYAGQDCAHCHPTEAGWGNNQEHEFLLPHPGGNVEECINCHPSPENRAGEFVCTDCHEQKATDAIHQIFQGYKFDSGACVGCHPDGA